jgi:hypothetical protein
MERNWGKISAIGTWVSAGVSLVLGVGTIGFMWWMYNHPLVQAPAGVARSGEANPVPVIPSWIPILIAVSLLAAGVLQLIAVRKQQRIGVEDRKDETAEDSRVPPGFALMSAKWGNEHNTVSIDDVIRLMPLNAVAFLLNPDAFRPYTTPNKVDPAPGPGKFLEVTGSYPGQPDVTFRRYEGDIVVLPPDPKAFREVREHASLVKKYESAQEEIVSLNAQLHPPLVFGDALQGIAGCIGEQWLSWWHVPVTAHQELRLCTIEITIGGSVLDGLWSVGHGDKPQRRLDVMASGDTVNIPIVARSEQDGMRLCAHPASLPDFMLAKGVALITDSQVIIYGRTTDRVLVQGEQTVRICVKADQQRYESTFRIYCPEADIGNGHFYMRNVS